MNVNLGIIGYGGMGKWHENNAPRVEGVEIKAVCDIDPEKLKDAEGKGYELYEDVDALLANPDINTVLLTVPSASLPPTGGARRRF